MPETPTPAASPAHSRRWILLALVVATVLKILWASSTAGSIDSILFYNFARSIDKHGLCEVYRMDSLFNHTPMTGGMAYGLYRLAQAASSEAPDPAPNPQPQRANEAFATFAFLLRFVMILADVVAVLAITANRERLGDPPTWALALFAASPVSLMISGFHGNVDPLMAAFLVLATIAAVRGAASWCGVALGLSCMVKVAVLPLIPVFFFYWLARRRAWAFVLACGAVGLAGTALPLIVCPREFLRNVLGYGSYWGTWGIPYLLRATGWEAVQRIDFRDLGTTQIILAQSLKITIIAGIAFLGWRRRNEQGAGIVVTIAASWVWFFVFAPGIGVQYFAWLSPFVLLACARSYAALTLTATNFLYVFYDLASQGRWQLAVPQDWHMAQWSRAGLWCWLTLVAILLVKARAWYSLPPPSESKA